MSTMSLSGLDALVYVAAHHDEFAQDYAEVGLHIDSSSVPVDVFQYFVKTFALPPAHHAQVMWAPTETVAASASAVVPYMSVFWPKDHTVKTPNLPFNMIILDGTINLDPLIDVYRRRSVAAGGRIIYICKKVSVGTLLVFLTYANTSEYGFSLVKASTNGKAAMVCLQLN